MYGGVGQNEYGGAKQVTWNIYLYAKTKGTHGDKINILFSHWNRESKTDDPVIISSLAFNSETKISSDSLCLTILILPHPTLHFMWIR